MKVNAYLLAADPAWIEAGVLSYYDLVDRIVLSYDRQHRGWTGKPLDVEQCLRRLRAIDTEGKLDFRPGHYAIEENFENPMLSDTHQRQAALDAASEGADWVVQLDTDEVVGEAAVLTDCLAEAERLDRDAVNLPSLYLYSHASGRWYLERGGRGFRRRAGYPGAFAVRAGARLSVSRRVEGSHYHADLEARGSEWRYPHGITVDRVLKPAQAIWHFSTVRDEASLRRKYGSWGHAKDRDWDPQLVRWLAACRHPVLASIKSQWERGNDKQHLRPARLPAHVAALVARSGCDQPTALPESTGFETVAAPVVSA